DVCRIAVAKKRKFAIARGMSSMRARLNGFPLSLASVSASSSKFRSIKSASRSSSFDRSAAGVFDHAGNAARAAATARSMSSASLSGTSAIDSSVAGLMSSKYFPPAGATNSPPMKLARRRNEFLRIKLPAIDIRIPRIPRLNPGHAIAKIRRNHFRNDERLLPPQLVRVAEFESEDAQDVAGDVPGGLRIPAVRNFDDHAETFGIFGMLDGETEKAVRAFFRDHATIARLEDRGIEPIESANEIGMRDHRVPDPVFFLFGDEVCELACE